MSIDLRPSGGFVDGAGWKSAATGHVDTIADAGSTASLRGSYAGPAHIRLGSVLHFAVTLENDGTVAVSLDPCPRMVDQLHVVIIKFPTIVGQHGPVNCARAPVTIRPGRAMTLQIHQFTVGEIVGVAGVYWTMLGRGGAWGPYVQGSVTIDPDVAVVPTASQTTASPTTSASAGTTTSRPSGTTRAPTSPASLAATCTFAAPLAGAALALILAGLAVTVSVRPRRHRH